MIDFSPMEKKQATPKVGVAVFIERYGKILMMLRSGSHRANTWSLPGGHMDVGEDFFTTCKREVKEELNIDIVNVDKFDFVNTIFPQEGLHYVTLYFKAVWDVSQEPKIMEPKKCKELKWFYPYLPPAPIFSDNARIMVKEFGKRMEI